MHKALGKGLEALIPGVTLSDGDVILMIVSVI